jgi:L-rhamnonate dehydratase
MRIQRVEASLHRVPVRVPLLDQEMTRQVVFTRVETDDGAVGYGLTGELAGRSVVECINHGLGPFLRGRDPLLTEQCWHEAYWRFNQRSLSGAVSSALSGVDIALWDLKGRVLGQPVWRLLGGYAARVPAYITFGLAEYSREQLVEAARGFVAAGQDKLKMVVAAEGAATDLAEDAARVRAVREAVGEGVQLMLDANQLLDPLRAAELCRLVEPLGITWFEEPLHGNDALKLAELRQKTRIPIAAGQNEGHRWRHRELILGGAVDIVQPNVLSVGGYTEAVKVAHLAQCFNLPVANGGGWPHHNAHLMAAVPNGWRVEFHLLMWHAGNAIYQDPPQPEAGWVSLPERPGLGLEPRQDALAEYRQNAAA